MDESNIPKSQIAGVQTVMPSEVTCHRKVRRISAGDPAGAGIFRRTLNIVLYYKHSSGDADSGWLVAGWIKESLGRALSENPMLSGRLRRRRGEGEEEDGGGLEVVANDSGVRMVEAKIPAKLPEFVELVKRDRSAKAEAQTLFWRDIDEHHPQFSPLFYVQVTNFECGGYSVGISCSILVADLLLGTDFLRRWSDIQTSILLMHQTTNNKIPKTPIFYLPALNQDLGLHLSDLSGSPSVHKHEKPSIFRAESASSEVETWEKVALICAGKAVGAELGGRTGRDVFLFVKERGEDAVEVRRSGKELEAKEINSNGDCSDDDVEIVVMTLEELGISEVRLWQGKRAHHSSCSVGSVLSDGFVLVVPSARDSDNSTAKVIVATPPYI